MSQLRKLLLALILSLFTLSLYAQNASYAEEIPTFNCLYEASSLWNFMYPDGWQITEQDEVVTINSPGISDLESDMPIPEGEIRIIINPVWQDSSYPDFTYNIYDEYGFSTIYDITEMELTGDITSQLVLEFHAADSSERVNDLGIVSFLSIFPDGNYSESAFIYEVAANTANDYTDFVEVFVNAILDTYNGVDTECTARSSLSDTGSSQNSDDSVYIASVNAQLVERDYQQTIYGQWVDFLPQSDLLFAYQNGNIQVIDASSLETVQLVSRTEIASESVSNVNQFWIDPTGTQLAYNYLNTLVLWNRDTNNVVELASDLEWFGRAIVRDSVRFSPDGKLLAYLSNVSEVVILDIQSGQEIAAFPVVEVEGGFRTLVFHPDGTHLFGFLGTHVYIWDMNNYTQIQVIQQSENSIYGWDMSPDGRFLAWADWAEVWIWDWNVSNPVRIGDAQQGPNIIFDQHLVPVAFDSTGQYLAFASIGNIVRVWDTSTQSLAVSFVAHEEKILGIQFNSIGTVLATFSQDNLLNFWDIPSDTLLHSIDTDLYRRGFTDFSFLRFSGDGSYLLLAGNGFVYKFGFAAGADIPVPQSVSSNSSTSTAEAKPISYEESLEATLSSDAGDQWRFSGSEGERILIRMSSSEFDTTLQLLDSSENMLLANDDANFATTDSTIIVDLPASGEFTIIAGSLDGSLGSYTLSLGLVTDDTVLVNGINTTTETNVNNAATTFTPTPSPTEISTNTGQEVDSSNASATQSATSEPDEATSEPTATSTLTSCPGELTPRMVIGEQGRVALAGGQANRLRSSPTTTARILAEMEPLETFAVVSGPACADGYTWWEVDFQGTVGWTAEASDDEYWLEPVIAENTTDTNCFVVASSVVNVRSGPGTSYDIVGQLSSGQRLAVISYELSSSNFRWLELENGAWVREDVVDLSGDCTTLMDSSEADDGGDGLRIGGRAQVYVEDDGLSLRTGAGTNFDLLEKLPSGTEVEILDGPVHANGYIWWNVRAPSGLEGWVVESADGITTLIPIP